jgi:hypothetical protein
MYKLVIQVFRVEEITSAWEVLILTCERKRPQRRPEHDLMQTVKYTVCRTQVAECTHDLTDFGHSSDVGSF